MDLIEILKPGSDCDLNGGKATVLQAMIRATRDGGVDIQYQVAWWSDNERKVSWVEEFEVSPAPKKVSQFAKIGFAG